MPYYIKHVPCVEWEIVLVEAENAEEAMIYGPKDEFLAEYRTGFDVDLSPKLFGPYDTIEEAMNSEHVVLENPA